MRSMRSPATSSSRAACSFTPQLDVSAAVEGCRLGGSGGRPIRLAQAALPAGPAPQVLFVDGANPVFTAPPAWRVREALEKVPYIVSFGSFLDETSVLADLILPDHSFLESWTEAVPESGAQCRGRQRGAGRDASAVRHARDAGRAARDRSPPAAPARAAVADVRRDAGGIVRQRFLADAGRRCVDRRAGEGDVVGHAAGGPRASVGRGASASWRDAQRSRRHASTATPGSIHFISCPYPSSAFLDGSLAHLPWLQEMPDPLTSAMWSSWVEINPSTAEKLGIGEGDVVEVASAQGTIRSAAVISPGHCARYRRDAGGAGASTFSRATRAAGVRIRWSSSRRSPNRPPARWRGRRHACGSLAWDRRTDD